MKRLITIIVLLLLAASRALAAGTVGITPQAWEHNGTVFCRTLTLAWVSDAADASVPATTINASYYGILGWFLYSVEQDPGTENAPLDNFDITIVDANSLDIAGGLLTNCDNATTELDNLMTAPHGYPKVLGNLTVNWANVGRNSAQGSLILVFIPDYAFLENAYRSYIAELGEGEGVMYVTSLFSLTSEYEATLTELEYSDMQEMMEVWTWTE